MSVPTGVFGRELSCHGQLKDLAKLEVSGEDQLKWPWFVFKCFRYSFILIVNNHCLIVRFGSQLLLTLME